MMRICKEYIVLILILILTFGLRIYFSFGSETFSSEDAYFNLRYIKDAVKGDFGLYDEYSYGGRFLIVPPLFYIVYAVLSFGNLFLLKLLPELFLSLIVLIVYMICKKMTENEWASIFSAAVSGFVPLFLVETVNSVSVYSLMLPLMLLMLYSLMNLNNVFWRGIFIVLSFALPFLHISAFLIVLVYLFYFFLLAGGAMHVTKLKKEAMFFSVIVVLFADLIMFRNVLAEQGLGIVWQNIPLAVMLDQFGKLSPVDLLFGVGVLPLIFGLAGLYIGVFMEKNKYAAIFSALFLALLILLFFRLIGLSSGIMLAGVSLGILSSLSLKYVFDYFNRTKFKIFFSILVFFVIILVVVFSFLPAVSALRKLDYVSSDVIEDMEWLKENSGDVVVMGNLQEGDLISSVAGKKNVLDVHFMFAEKPLERYQDMELLYKTWSEAAALEVIRKYDVDVIYFSDSSKEIFNKDELRYTADKSCFDERLEGIYFVVC